jgi:hypothetical protein
MSHLADVPSSAGAHTSFASGISASSTARSTKHPLLIFKIIVPKNGIRRVELAGT